MPAPGLRGVPGTSGSNGLTAGTTRGEDVEGEGDGSTSSWQVTPRAEK